MSPASAYAPGRVELLGNHTDYNEGVVLAAAIDLGLTAAGIARQDNLVVITSRASGQQVQVSLGELEPPADAHWARYPLGVVEQFARAGFAQGGFEAEISGDLPAGAGLASSAALEVATAGLLMKLHELRLAPLEVAKLCQRAENDFVGVRSGLLDQVASIFGRAGYAVFLDFQTEEIRVLPFPGELALIVAVSGGKHDLLQSFYNERREECAAAADALGAESLREVTPDHLELAGGSLDPVLYRRAAHIVGENDRVWRALAALEIGDAEVLGELMNASHESSRTNFENSTVELDELVTRARALPGVLGARLTGGGFGGAIVALVRANDAEDAAASLRVRGRAESGSTPQVFVCRPAEGAAARWAR
ncbi:MAG: galactokinase [Chthoniobacterales bacterium]